MAIFSSLSLPSYFSLLLLLLQLLSLTTTNGSPLLDKVCGQTKDPSLCKKYITTDSRSETAGPPLLAEITVDTAQVEALNTKTKIHSFLMNARNPVLKGLYTKCENLYLDSLDDLFRVAEDELAAHQYLKLGQLGVRVRGRVNQCEAAFNNNSPFKAENKVVGVLVEAITAIAKIL